MAKYNILLVMPNSDVNGLQYHRQVVPHNYLAQHNEDFRVVKTPSIDAMSGDQLKEFQLVHFLREVDLTFNFRAKYTIERLNKLGLKVVFDIDDYWRVDKTHAFNDTYRTKRVPEQIEETLRLVDCVTTTTEYMADKIRPFNKNVVVIANAINPEEPQWQPRKIENNRLRFGWIGGVHHKPDIELLRYSFEKLHNDKDFRDNGQMLLGGFNVVVSFTDENEAELVKLGLDTKLMRKMSFVDLTRYFLSKGLHPPMPEYINLERIFTNDYKDIQKFDKPYYDYLRSFVFDAEHIANDKYYKRLWGRNVWNYGQMYNDIDVALVPLVDNEFNNSKSQLKIIEAGFMNKAVIVSGVMPYTIDCDWSNSIVIDKRLNQLGWFMAIKKLMNEPNLRLDLAAKLNEMVTKKYHIKVQTEVRKDLYNRLCE